jgi:hypothetical protein
MNESQNIQIPISLFRNIVLFFNFLSLKEHTFPAYLDFEGIISDLHKKQHRINMRTVYSKAIYAKNDEQRQSDFRDYSKLKKDL